MSRNFQSVVYSVGKSRGRGNGRQDDHGIARKRQHCDRIIDFPDDGTESWRMWKLEKEKR